MIQYLGTGDEIPTLEPISLARWGSDRKLNSLRGLRYSCTSIDVHGEFEPNRDRDLCTDLPLIRLFFPRGKIILIRA